MTQQQWLIWLVTQSNSITGPIDAFMQGQRDAYEEAAWELDQCLITITLSWVMARIADERRRILLAAHDLPERDYRRNHQGRLFAYEHIRMQFVP